MGIVAYIQVISESNLPSKTKRFVFVLKTFPNHAVLPDRVKFIRRKMVQRNPTREGSKILENLRQEHLLLT